MGDRPINLDRLRVQLAASAAAGNPLAVVMHDRIRRAADPEAEAEQVWDELERMCASVSSVLAAAGPVIRAITDVAGPN